VMVPHLWYVDPWEHGGSALYVPEMIKKSKSVARMEDNS